jgi:hypothetical protein
MSETDSEPWQDLRVGDRVRIARRPSDWQRLHEPTLRAYDRLIADGVVLTIDEIDELGHPWVTHRWPHSSRGFEFDSLAINDDSWERVTGEGEECS